MSEKTDTVIDALFASDLARDVRSEFNARREEGFGVNDATGAVVAHFRHLLDRPDEGAVVIIAIAMLQLLERAASRTFRDAALDLLHEGHGFAPRPGEDPTLRRDRERLRQQLIAMLESAEVSDEPEMS